ncbi:MAG: TPM domain-containing protein [Saprospiraceae bacterium]|nr:TPM domain-containing protein [Saprospiraceae bacterium]
MNYQIKFLMVNRQLRFFIILAICFHSIVSIFGQTKAVPRPFNPPRLVNDYINLLSTIENQNLEKKLVAYNDSTSIQIAIVLEETTGGENIVTYAQRLSEEWGIGQGDSDNGILLLVTTKERGLRIHTGYGAEIFLTDGMSKRIIDNVISPNFRNKQFYQGLDKATEIIMQLGTGEYQAVSSNRNKGIPPELIIILIIIIIVVISVIKNRDRWDDGDDGGYYRGGKYEDYGRPSRRRGRGWVVMPGSGGSFGSSGGGFGGFGGGSFGGGGASGSW